MINEKSVGIIVFRFHPQEGLQYLVLYHRGSYWNFPKGKMELGENESQTALRELDEETGLNKLKIVDGWRQETEFFFKENRSGKMELIKKKFIIFLAKAQPNMAVKISSEHNGYGWLDYKTAVKYLKFKSLKSILTEADSYIKDKVDKYKKLNSK